MAPALEGVIPSPRVCSLNVEKSWRCGIAIRSQFDVRTGILHFQACVQRVNLVFASEIRSRPNVFNRQIVRAALKMSRCGASFFLSGPAMAEQYPASRSSLESHAPFEAIVGVTMWLLAIGARWAAPEFIRSFLVHEQCSGPGDIEALRATQQSSARVLEQEPVMDADELRQRWSNRGTKGRQNGRHRSVFAIPYPFRNH